MAHPVEVVFECNPILARYLSSKPLHDSQQITKLDDSIQVTLNVIITYELIQWILGYSSEVKVISPSLLKEKLSENLKKSQELNGIS